jgi:NADH-quinone oxidoreductase subunit G
MAKITIDNREFEVKGSEYLIDIALENDIKIPHYCYHPALSRPANCRMCLVEVEKAPKPLPACITKVQDKMVVYTNSPKAQQARKRVLEYMLINHPVDCPICDKAGECSLQNYYFDHNAQLRRAPDEKVKKKKVVDIGPTLILDSERCILCTRCIRFMEEIANYPCFGIVNKGAYSELVVFPEKKIDNPYSLNTVDLCPVGALTSKDFRFQQRVWFLKKTPSICSLCATGCNTYIEHSQNKVFRITPRFNQNINGYFMCDYGRLYYRKIQENLLQCSILNGQLSNNKLEVLQFLHSLHSCDKILFFIGQNMTIEELEETLSFAKSNPSRYFLSWIISNKGFLDTDFADNYLIDIDKNPNTEGLKKIISQIPQNIKIPPDAIGNLNPDLIFIFDEFFYLRTQRNFIDEFVNKFRQKIIYFSSMKNEFTSCLPTTIAVPSIYEKSGSFTNKNGILQKFQACWNNKDKITFGEVLQCLQ